MFCFFVFFGFCCFCFVCSFVSIAPFRVRLSAFVLAFDPSGVKVGLYHSLVDSETSPVYTMPIIDILILTGSRLSGGEDE